MDETRHGDTAMRRCGEVNAATRVFAMKWLHRIAQGFSPGSGTKRTDLKVSADGADRPTLQTVLY